MNALLLALATGVIPSTPLMWGHFGVMTAITNAMLILCVVALWFERERSQPVKRSFPFGDEERLAA